MGRKYEGGVEPREKSLRITFQYQGKQRKETLYIKGKPAAPTPANIKYAHRVADEVRDKIRFGTFVYADYFPHSKLAVVVQVGQPMLYDTFDRFLRLHELKASTKRTYESRIRNFWKKKLPDQPIASVRYSDILEVLKAQDWSPKSYNNELSLISQVFEFALADRLITVDPTTEIKRRPLQKAVPDPFSQDEINSIIKYLREHRDEQIANFVEFLSFTGLRTSEALALKWSTIEFEDGKPVRAVIEGANVYDEESDSTKTYEARTVKLVGRARQVLERQKAHTFMKAPQDDDHVFHDPATGEPWGYRKITDVRGFWKQTLLKLGIRYRRPYSMRHTYATVGLMANANPAFLAKQLGHSLRMFYTVYAKWIESDDDSGELDKIDSEIERKTGSFLGGKDSVRY
jgi:integrase